MKGGENSVKSLCNVYPRECRELTSVLELVNGKVLTNLENINVGERGYIRPIDGGGVHTSTIQEVDYLCEGDIRIITRNSIYELTSMDGDDDAS